MLTSQNAPHHNCGWRIEQEWALIQSTMLVRLTVLKEVNTVEACMVYPQNAFDNWTSDFPSTQLCYKFTIRQQGAGVPATRCSIQRWPASCTYLFVTLVVHKKQQRITMACSKFVRTWTSCHVIRRPSDLKAHLSMRLRLTTLSSKVSARCLMLSHYSENEYKVFTRRRNCESALHLYGFLYLVEPNCLDSKILRTCTWTFFASQSKVIRRQRGMSHVVAGTNAVSYKALDCNSSIRWWG